jgi:arylsulfatase A-like enzyme
MRPPNFLIFMADQMQAEVAHPDHPCQMPHAARLAREGVVFRQAYCPTAHCCPARATFLTGLYPSRHGVYNNVLTPTAIHFGLNPGVVTFSELLREAGYALAWAGKWHATAEENPSDRGWEELLVTSGRGGSHHSAIEQWRQQAQTPDLPGPRPRGQILRPGWGPYQLYRSYPTDGTKGYEQHGDYQVVQAAVPALPRLAGSGQPWFLYVGVNGPHDPFHVPERFARRYDPQQVPLPPNFPDPLDDKPRIYRRMRRERWGQLTEEEVREAIAHYWAYCTMEDAMLGEVLAALEATGQAEDTCVVFLSDHGDYAGAHGLFCKGVPAFREAYHIPCIVRYPRGLVRPGREVEEFVTLADWSPTFLELAGVPAPEGLTGRSLAPFLRGEAPEDWPDAFHSQFNGVELYYTQRMVVTKEFKYVFNGFDDDELYDLRRDPHELVNRAEHPDYQEVKRELVRRMWRFAAREGDELLFNGYVTVSLAPWGPKEGLGERRE